MSKLTFELDLKGGETAAQKVRDLTKEVATLKGTAKGIAFNDFSTASESFRRQNPQLFAELGRKAGTAFENARFEAMNDLARRNITGSSASEIARQAAIAQGDYDINNPKRRPPIIRTPSAGGSGSGGGRVGQLLGFFGGDASGGLSKIFAGLGAFRIALWELQPVIRVVQFAMREFAASIKEGSKLFTDAAKLGQSAFKTAQLDFAANSLNISSQEAQRLALYAEFSRSVTGGGNQQGTPGARSATAEIGGQAFGAGRGIGTVGDLQELTNLQKQFNDLQRKGLLDSILQGKNAETAFKLQAQFSALLNDFKTTMSELVVLSGPALDSLLFKARLFFLLLNLGLDRVIGWAEFLHLIERRSDPNFTQSVFGNNTLNPNQFQKMGFKIAGGFPGSDVMKTAATKTAQNTSTIVAILQGIGENIGASGALFGIGAISPVTNSP